MPVAAQELARLTAVRPAASLDAQPDASLIVEVPDIALPGGWSLPTTTVRWVLTAGYPAAQPDCFYTDLELRLANGAMPMNSGVQTLQGRQLLWFSWHIQGWRPGRDDLLSYLRFTESRLADVR
jgi:hypothetical protein